MTEIMGTTCSMIYLGRHVMSRNKELLWYLSQKRDVPCSNDILYIYIHMHLYKLWRKWVMDIISS